MRRLMACIAERQAKNGVAPSYCAIAVAVGTSPSQAKRLVARAETTGFLKRCSESPLRFAMILNPPHSGVVRVPLVECTWSRSIRWLDSEARGVWLDRAAFRIEGDVAGLWAVTFPERPRDGQMPLLRLDEYALALVRRCILHELEEAHWYLVEHAGRVMVGSFFKRVGGRLIFRAGAGDTSPQSIVRTDIAAIAEVMMTTTRPPIPNPQLSP